MTASQEASTSQPLVTRRLASADVTAEVPLVDELSTLIESHGTLYEWAGNVPQPSALRGRAPVFVAALPVSRDVVVVRHAWHGGLLAPITGDRFRRPSRAPHEYDMSRALRIAGVPTTVVLGFARYDAGPGICRVDVITRFVPDAFDLGMVASGLVPDITVPEALLATRTLLVQLAEVGVVHPDLNVKNILLSRDKSDSVTAMIIDVDVIRWDRHREPLDLMRTNLARLERSMRKWQAQFGCDVTEQALEQFRRDTLAVTPATASTRTST